MPEELVIGASLPETGDARTYLWYFPAAASFGYVTSTPPAVFSAGRCVCSGTTTPAMVQKQPRTTSG